MDREGPAGRLPDPVRGISGDGTEGVPDQLSPDGSGASARRGSHHPAAWMIVLPEAEQRPSHQPVRAGAGVQEKSKGGSTRSSWPPRSRKMCSTRTRDKSSNFGSGYTSERNGLPGSCSWVITVHFGSPSD